MTRNSSDDAGVPCHPTMEYPETGYGKGLALPILLCLAVCLREVPHE